MRIINQIIAVILLGWMGVFTQLSTSHMGHGHDLLPAEANLCAIDCEEESHHGAGEACQWFMAKRLTNHDGIVTVFVQMPVAIESIPWAPQYFLSAASHNYVHWDRGPPVA